MAGGGGKEGSYLLHKSRNRRRGWFSRVPSRRHISAPATPSESSSSTAGAAAAPRGIALQPLPKVFRPLHWYCLQVSYAGLLRVAGNKLLAVSEGLSLSVRLTDAAYGYQRMRWTLNCRPTNSHR